jgi:uncharacterized membrane protein
MLQSRGAQRRRSCPRVPPVSATLPIPPPLSNPDRRPSAAAIVLVVYLLVLASALLSGRVWLEDVAAFLLATLLLWPALRRRSVLAGLLWLAIAIGIAALSVSGRGSLALDFTPVMVNAALCSVFARTLAPGREPLIARVIAVLESPARLALPHVADYARKLTFAWALLLGAQALLLTILILCAVPDGLLSAFGVEPPIEISGSLWRWYLHLGSYATVLAFLVIEYAYRRWHLRHIPHVSLPTFVTRLVRRWPALARSVVSDLS